MPHGQFSADFLNSLRTLLGRGASIVIPEVVIWEWAEHARANAIATEESIKQFRVDPGLLDRPVSPPTPSAIVLAKRIESLLSYDISVWCPDEEAWRNAVRDQVLQIGSGEMKGNIKTGAADAIVLACVEDEAEHAEGVVVLLTSDKFLRKAAANIGESVRTANGTRVLLETLNTFTPHIDVLELNLTESLSEYLNERIINFGEAIPFRDIGIQINFAGQTYEPDSEEDLSSITLKHVDIAEVHGLSVKNDDEEARIGLVNLRLFGKILADYVGHHEAPSGEVMMRRETIDVSNNFIDVTVAIKWNHNWVIESIIPTGVALLVFDDGDEGGPYGVPTFRAVPLKG